jgi:hypothetical protein
VLSSQLHWHVIRLSHGNDGLQRCDSVSLQQQQQQQQQHVDVPIQ